MPGKVRKPIAPANTPGIIASIVTSGFATLNELQTVYGSYDTYRLYELCVVKHLNEIPDGNDY